MRKSKLDEKQIAEAMYWRARGMSWAQLGKLYDVSIETMRRALDPEYAAHRYALERARNRRRQPEIKSIIRHEVRTAFRPSETEFRRLQKLIPRDTRDLTGRLLGDPLPGRSALDRKASGAGA